ncbi:lysylphosphatidylglycerol synthase transmembrane domain-containing protein [Marixanthomonas spongiae]|uniref:TIGR00374 family protein n=1 Tax=Marixanthomonas spongiae TaxID=2174845 RepID=A0A2U0HZD9_9FLAO|nr:lysylphosphatidylglycerol synthase transmembrane domain-containing protein [Marixanthomonas spongiae]PVW14235.1 TIGR00374 family protein [Marixanthomonas spongiae]
MKKSLTKFLKIALPLALGIFLVYYSYTKFTPEQLDEIAFYFKKADYTFIVLSVLCSLVSHIIRAVRWNLLLQPIGYSPKLFNNFMAISVAYLMNMFIPKSGEVSRGIVLDKYEHVPFDKGFGTIISERVVDLVFLMFFTALALFLEFDDLYAFLTEYIKPSKLFLAIGILVVAAIVFFIFLNYSKAKFTLKIKQFLLGLKDGIFSIFKMRKKGSFIVQTFLIWGLYVLSFYVATFAVDDTAAIPLGTVIIAFVVGSFAFAFTNSGFGSYPFFVAAILAVFGIPETAGTAFGWIVWTSNIILIVLVGGLSFLLLPIYNKVEK